MTLRIFVAALLLSVMGATAAYGLSAEGNEHPGRLTKSRGKTYYNYNIRSEIERDDEGKSRLVFKWDYVVIEGAVTREKILAALKAEREGLTTEALNQVEAEYEAMTE